MSASPSDGGSSTRARLRPADGDAPTARTAFAVFTASTSAASASHLAASALFSAASALFSAASALFSAASASHFASSASIRAMMMMASSDDPTASPPAVAPSRRATRALLPRIGGAIAWGW